MCAGQRLGCKDSTGSSDYFLLLVKKKFNEHRYSSIQGITLPSAKLRW